MRKKLLFKINVVVLTLIAIGLSGCNKESDNSNISQSIEHATANEFAHEDIEQISDTKGTSNRETISTPYKIDTIAKAEISDTYRGYCSYTHDKNDNLYYIDNNCIYKINAYNGTPNKLLDAKDIIIDNEEMTLSDFNITSIAYNDSADKLYMTGKYHSVNSAKNVSSYYLYSINNSDIEAVTDTFKDNTVLIKILNSGDYVVEGDWYSNPCIINCQTYEETYTKPSYIYDVYDNDIELYIATPNEIYKYNYMEYTSEWSKRGQAVGINDKYAVFAQDNIIEICNLNGKTMDAITAENVTVLDKTQIATNSFEKKILLTSKSDIVFYDKSAKSFRMIEKNPTTDKTYKTTSDSDKNLYDDIYGAWLNEQAKIIYVFDDDDTYLIYTLGTNMYISGEYEVNKDTILLRSEDNHDITLTDVTVKNEVLSFVSETGKKLKLSKLDKNTWEELCEEYDIE